jgi:C-methyltransferase
MHNAALLLGSRLNHALWGDLERTVQTGQNAFERLYGPVWQWFAAHPEDVTLFVNGMASMTAMEAPALSAAYPYGRFRVLCDVGGGSGLFVACILARFPKLRAVLFDHESMLEHARGYTEPNLGGCTLCRQCPSP